MIGVGQRAALLLKGAVSILLIAYLLQAIGIDQAWNTASKLRPLFGVAAVVAFAFYIVLGAVRWLAILRATGSGLSVSEVMRITYVGSFFSQFLPGAIGGDGVRMWESSRSGLPGAEAVSSVLLERIVHIAVLSLIAVLVTGFPDAAIFPMELQWTVWVVFGACGIGAAVVAHLDSARWRTGHGPLSELRAKIWADFDKLRRSGWTVVTLFASVVVGQVLLASAAYAIAQGLGIDLPLLALLVLMPTIALLSSIPVSVAGWGVREYAMVGALSYYGVNPAAALALSLVFGFFYMLASLPGGIAWMISRKIVAK